MMIINRIYHTSSNDGMTGSDDLGKTLKGVVVEYFKVVSHNLAKTGDRAVKG
jgi:hypothetical protein